MTRYIEEDALLNVLNSQDLADWLDKQDEYTPAAIVEHALKELPPADVAPIRHGNWIAVSTYDAFGGDEVM